ncbi:outer membrane protein chaperone [Bordetella genomosp. 10]|uniref:Outer membrane protein chaperone n=1 Tax=Bordetella genomosp. 10 TaxID=1416804 RepID=A0A261SC54_9BORD|nr:OmpH family outer membrane protein [Bordetella genomosp. 10]OZI34979.1 outer membrane protein chaperone [Bordetella genomosp. 10]
MMSDFARNLSRRISRAASVNLMGTLVLAGALLAGGAYAAPAAAQGTKIGFVNTERILRESGPAKAAQAKIESEFKRRDDDLQRAAAALRAQAEKYDKDAPVLSEGDRVKRQRDLSNSDADLQRRRREFQEDFNRRRNEEFSSIVEKANAAIKRIAEQENYDLILQDAVTVNPRVDITDKVIQALGK